MSKAAENLLELDKTDFRILQGIEVGMRTSEYVSFDSIVDISKIRPDEVIHRLDNLHYRELITRWKGQFIGYHLTHHGYDVLAFRALSERDSIVAIGTSVGRGKESDVFLAFNEKQETFVAKIHRVGRPSFQRSKRLRSYIGSRGHINWLYKSRLSAEREVEGLKRAEEAKIKTPRVVDSNRHIIIMDFYEGVELVNVGELKNPLKLFNNIISELRKIVVKCGIVHADLSEYNILVTPKEDFLIIDFPQFEEMDHENALDYLKRDISNVCRFFKRKYRIQSDTEAIFDAIIDDYQKNNE